MDDKGVLEYLYDPLKYSTSYLSRGQGKMVAIGLEVFTTGTDALMSNPETSTKLCRSFIKEALQSSVTFTVGEICGGGVGGFAALALEVGSDKMQDSWLTPTYEAISRDVCNSLGFVLDKNSPTFSKKFAAATERLEGAKAAESVMRSMLPDLDRKIKGVMNGSEYDAWFGTAQRQGNRKTWIEGIEKEKAAAQDNFQDYVDATKMQ
jgi:hypothetical protein